MSGQPWAWVLLVVIFAGGVAVGGLVVSLAGSRREASAYDEGRADERAERTSYDAGDGRPAIAAGHADDLGDEAGERVPEHGMPDWPDRAAHGDRRRQPPAPLRPDIRSDPRVEAETVVEAWAPQPGDRVYQWAHHHPIRATAPLTVIDWDALPWEERQLLTVWDWGRRMQAWVEDWDREKLEAA